MIKPIGYINTDFKEKFGIPRQSLRVKEAIGIIHFYDEYSVKEAFEGIEEYSHLWLLFDFSKSHSEKFSPKVRPPRLGGNKKVGVFATRSPNRPNNIGLSVVKLEEVIIENNRVSLKVSGVDLLDNTPIYDIKPYIPYCDCQIDAKGSFSSANQNHHLDVIISNELLKKIPVEIQDAILGCLKDDPRPSYIQDEERIYGMRYQDFNISFKVKEDKLIVTEVIKI